MDWIQRKLLSQNFLHNRALVKRLVGLSSLEKFDTVLEIGPGDGIITEELSKIAKRVLAVEIDPILAENLKQKFMGSNVRIETLDFRSYQLPASPYKVFANIPFSLTAEIIHRLLSALNPPLDTYLIMQKDAAEKFAGIPHVTQFSLLMKPWFDFSIIWQFKKTDFFPPPHVEIVLLRIQKREAPLIQEADRTDYRTFITYAFSQWKRNLRLGLKQIFTYSQWKRLAKDNQFEKDAKPTDLAFEQWFALYTFFKEVKERSLH